MDLRSGCPINLSVEVLGDRWSLVRHLHLGASPPRRSVLAELDRAYRDAAMAGLEA